MLGERRLVYTNPSSSDIDDINDLISNDTSNQSSIIKWLIKNEFAYLSNINEYPIYFDKWSRNISSLTNYVTLDDAIKIQEDIFGLSFMIIGVGGIGCNVILQLINIGVKNIIIIDDDVVESSNLNRQILFSKNDIGIKKVDAAKKSLLNNYVGLNITTYDNNILDFDFNELTGMKIDFVVVSADSDSLRIRKLISKHFFKLNTPYGFLSYFGNNAVIGPLIFSNLKGCGCCLGNVIDIKSRLEEINGAGILNIPPSSFSINTLCVSIYINEIIKYLCGVNKENVQLTINLDNYNFQQNDIKKYENCETCGKIRL